MKKFILFSVIFASIECQAATGNASDGELALLSIILLLLLPIATIHFIGFVKNRIHDIQARRMGRKNMIQHNGEL